MTAFPFYCRRILLATSALLAFGASQAMAQSPFTLSGSPPVQPPANMKTGEGALMVSARYSNDGSAINGGLHWRGFSGQPGPHGGVCPPQEGLSAAATLLLAPGDHNLC